MTTQVRIENLGPDHVKVSGAGIPVTLAPGETLQMYVWRTQDISISEVHPIPTYETVKPS